MNDLRVRNFRCYRDEIPVDFGDITAFIGKNDVGKSSIMEALDIFLNDRSPDSDDASKDGDGKDLAIICEFSGFPAAIVIDDKNPTTLIDEHLLNADGCLEVHKKYSGHAANPKCTGVFLYAVHPTAVNVGDLLQLKNPELKARAQALQVDMTGVDQRFNAPIRQRIRGAVGTLDLQPTLIPLDEKTNWKNVWDNLKLHLPTFALFKSDRESTDQDPEAQNPLKAAVGDLFNEGNMDVVVGDIDGSPMVLRNQGIPGRHWVSFELAGVKSNRLALNARIKIVAGGMTQTSEIHSGGSYLSQNDVRVHFGLGMAKKLTVWRFTGLLER